jgi:hypothetical protein
MSAATFLQIQRNRRVVHSVKRVKRSSVSSNKRYNEFRPEEHTHLELLREGVSLEDSPDNVHEELTEEHLFHFVCDHPSVERCCELTPKYVGVLRVFHPKIQRYLYVHPLNDDFAKMYEGRCDDSRALEVLVDGTPYWVDAYAMRMLKKKK